MSYHDTAPESTAPAGSPAGRPRAPRSLARHRLTAAFVRSVAHQGKARGAERHHDGGGLYLQVMPTGSKQWVHRLSFEGVQYYYGLGPTTELTLAEARDRAAENTVEARRHRRAVARGESPPLPAFEAQRRATMARRRGMEPPMEVVAAAGLTFGEAFERYVTEQAGEWKDPKTGLRSHRADLRKHLGAIAPLPVAGVEVFHLRRALEPLTRASRNKVLRRCGSVFKWAVARKLRRDNPAEVLRQTWTGLKREEVPHRAAMPWAEVPDFYARLEAEGLGANARGALALALLTGVRSGEATGARWEEVQGLDSGAPVWTIPAARMKDKREHRVPLSPKAVAVLREAGPKGEGPVFRAPRGGKVIDKALRQVMADLGAGYTVHGLRATLSGWAREQGVAHEAIERALAHRVGSAVSQAYSHTTDLLDRRRREVMDPWGAYVAGGGR